MLGYLSSSVKSLVERTVLPQSAVSERVEKETVPLSECERYKTFVGQYCKLRVTLRDSREWIYFDTGPSSKDPLVCIPGTSGTAEVYFEQALSLNIRGYRVITVSIAAVKSPEEFVASFKVFCEHLGHSSSRPLHLLGSSLGGFLALCFAEKHPRWIKSLVLTNAFSDTSLFKRNAGSMVGYSMDYMPEWYLRRFIASPLPIDYVTSDTSISSSSSSSSSRSRRSADEAAAEERAHSVVSQAMAVDFVLKQSEQLTREQLVSRVSLNLSGKKVEQLNFARLSPDCITIIDPCDSVNLPTSLRSQLYKLLAKAKWCPLKSGGDFPYLANAQSYTVMLQVHLRRNGGFEAEHRGALLFGSSRLFDIEDRVGGAVSAAQQPVLPGLVSSPGVDDKKMKSLFEDNEDSDDDPLRSGARRRQRQLEAAQAAAEEEAALREGESEEDEQKYPTDESSSTEIDVAPHIEQSRQSHIEKMRRIQAASAAGRHPYAPMSQSEKLSRKMSAVRVIVDEMEDDEVFDDGLEPQISAASGLEVTDLQYYPSHITEEADGFRQEDPPTVGIESPAIPYALSPNAEEEDDYEDGREYSPAMDLSSAAAAGAAAMDDSEQSTMLVIPEDRSSQEIISEQASFEEEEEQVSALAFELPSQQVFEDEEEWHSDSEWDRSSEEDGRPHEKDAEDESDRKQESPERTYADPPAILISEKTMRRIELKQKQVEGLSVAQQISLRKSSVRKQSTRDASMLLKEIDTDDSKQGSFSPRGSPAAPSSSVFQSMEAISVADGAEGETFPSTVSSAHTPEHGTLRDLKRLRSVEPPTKSRQNSLVPQTPTKSVTSSPVTGSSGVASYQSLMEKPAMHERSKSILRNVEIIPIAEEDSDTALPTEEDTTGTSAVFSVPEYVSTGLDFGPSDIVDASTLEASPDPTQPDYNRMGTSIVHSPDHTWEDVSAMAGQASEMSTDPMIDYGTAVDTDAPPIDLNL